MGEKELTRRMVDGLDVHQVNPMNDVLFKFIFGKIERKNITIDFLNAVLEPSLGHKVKDIHFQKPIREMTKMERWMAYFANRMNQSEKEELAMSEAAINKAYDATGIFLQDKAERLKYINREMALMDYRSGMMSAEERGEKRGEKRGEERGEKRADERYSRLIQILMSQKRMDDIGRIAADAAYRKKLYQEFHL